jgi:hypothetical protein
MARDPQQLRKAYEYKLGKELTVKLSDAQISELSKYYNSLPSDQQSDVDSEVAMGKGEFLDTARSFAKESQKEKAKVTGQKIRQKAEADVGDFAQQERDLDALNTAASEKKIPKGLDSLLKEIRTEGGPKKGKKSSALTVIPKRVEHAEQKLIDEDIDPKILELLGIDDPTGLDYSDYKSLLKEKMIVDRMGSQVDSGSSEILTDEFKRIKEKSGKFTVKNQKIKAATFVAKKKEPSSSARVVTPIPLLPQEVDEDIKPERQSVDKTFALIASKLNSVDNNVQQTTKNIQKKDDIEKKQDDRERIDTEIAGNQERENITERKNLLVGTVSNIKKSLKPVTSMVSGLFDFFKRLGFAIFIMELMKFLENPAKYINEISKFINNQIEKLEKSVENFVIDKMIKPLNGQIGGLNKNIKDFVTGINTQLEKLKNIPLIGDSVKTITAPEIPLINESIIKDKVSLGRVPLVDDNFLGGGFGSKEEELKEETSSNGKGRPSDPGVKPQETLMGEGAIGGGGGMGRGDEMGSNVFDTIVSGEGDVNSVNRGVAGDTPGGAQSIFGKDLTEMTVGEIMDAQDRGDVFAVGKYQIIPSTMKEFVSGSDVKRSDKFTEATQDKFRDYVINIKRPEVGKYLRGETDDPTEAGQALAREFASVGLQYAENKRQRGQGRYDNDSGGNKASISPEEITAALKKDRAAISKPSKQPSSALPLSTPEITDEQKSDMFRKSGMPALTNFQSSLPSQIGPPLSATSVSVIGGLGGGETPNANTTTAGASQSTIVAFSAFDPTNPSILGAKTVYGVVG